MNKEQFENEKAFIIAKLNDNHYLKLSTNEVKFKLVDDNHNPINYYSIRILNNLLDEKLIVNIGGKFISSTQNNI